MHAIYPQKMWFVRVRLDLCVHQESVALALQSMTISIFKGGGQI